MFVLYSEKAEVLKRWMNDGGDPKPRPVIYQPSLSQPKASEAESSEKEEQTLV